jgi:hypothetical protein
VPVPAGESLRHSGSGGRKLRDSRQPEQRPRPKPPSGNLVRPGENALLRPTGSAGRWRKPQPRRALRSEERPREARRRRKQPHLRPFRSRHWSGRTPGDPHLDGRYKCRCTWPPRYSPAWRPRRAGRVVQWVAWRSLESVTCDLPAGRLIRFPCAADQRRKIHPPQL